jgi:methylated-DNA-[protein]-cysteine S-methyltransferase
MTECFNDKCYELLKKVPRGKVVTYKEIGRKLRSKAYRAVGNAMNHNKDLKNIHCYRVIKSDGNIGGYALGAKKKIQLLRKDGIIVKNNRIDLKKFGFKF